MMTRTECLKEAKGFVCSQCGEKLTALETVDNAGKPTHWTGCGTCCRFDYGITPQIYGIAKVLVAEHGFGYRRVDPDDDDETKSHRQKCRISEACGIVKKILRIKNELDAGDLGQTTKHTERMEKTS